MNSDDVESAINELEIKAGSVDLALARVIQALRLVMKESPRTHENHQNAKSLLDSALALIS